MERLPLIIVSDIHLSADAGLDDFTSDEEFADLLRFYQSKEENYHLVINGDFIDFLQMDPRRPEGRKRSLISPPYPLNEGEKEAEEMLRACAKRHPLVFEAIREFLLKEGNRVSILKGNHDPEFAWRGVRGAMREILGDPPEGRLDFPERGLHLMEKGIYIEHGHQFDPWNSFLNIKSPFISFKKRRRINFPLGSILVRVFWNRVEPVFPFIDKVRPMTDSGLAVIARHPTFLLFHFDYLLDLLFGFIKRDILSLFASSSGEEGTSPMEGILLNYEKRTSITKYLLLFMALVACFFVLDVALNLGEEGNLLSASRLIIREWHPFLAMAGGGLLLLMIGKVLYPAGRAAGLSQRAVSPLHRMWIFLATLLFLGGLLRVLWIPVLIFFLYYILKDGISSASPMKRVGDIIFNRPFTNELEAAVALIKEGGARTVIFGHTHIPLAIDIPGGSRYINSGTWIKTILLREVRERFITVCPYVLVDREGKATLFSWRGTIHHKEIFP